MNINNKWMINKWKFIGIIILIICLIVTYFFNSDSNDSQKSYLFFASITLIELMVFSFVNTKLNKRILNFAFIFVICLFLFNFGQVFLMGFFPDSCKNLTIVLRYFEQNKLFYGLKIINYQIVAICIAIIISSKDENKDLNGTKKQFDENVIKQKALLIIFMTFPIKLIIDLILLYTGLTKGFVASKAVLLSIPDVLVTYGNFSVLGFYLLLIALKNKKNKQKTLYFSIVIYIMIIMLTGRRSENVAYICIFTYIYLSDKKMNIRNFILFLILAFFGLTFLNAVVYNRAYSTGITQALNYTLKHNNILFETLREYGNTVYTSLITIIEWLPKYPLALGKSYYLGVSSIIPNFFGTMGDLTRISNYGFTLQNAGVLYNQYKNIGGSLIGEFIFNFGSNFSIIAGILVGCIVGKISKKTQDLVVNKSTYNYNVIYYFAMMAGILYWIRDYFSGMIREIAWGIVFCWIISKIKIRKEEKNEQ